MQWTGTALCTGVPLVIFEALRDHASCAAPRFHGGDCLLPGGHSKISSFISSIWQVGFDVACRAWDDALSVAQECSATAALRILMFDSTAEVEPMPKFGECGVVCARMRRDAML